MMNRSIVMTSATVDGSEVITIERFIMEQERLHPEATGELSNLLYDLCLAAKIISRQVRRAGLSDILGAADSGAVNVSGDLQQKLDLFARDTVRHAVQHTGRVCIVASEEDEQPMLCPKASRRGKYVIMYDPHAPRGEVLQREREQLEPLDAGGAARGGGVQERRRPHPGEERPLHRVAGRRFPPQPDLRRHLSVSRGQPLRRRQAAAVVRGGAAGAGGGAGGGARDRRAPTDSRPRPQGVAPEDPLHRGQQGGRPARRGDHRRRWRAHVSDRKPVYSPEDWRGGGPRPPRAPGAFPFTRGVHPTMYGGKLWTMRQYAGFGTAEETNARFRHLLAAGQTGLSVAFDLPTQMGYDSDHPMAEGEVGRAGGAIDTGEELGRAVPEDPPGRGAAPVDSHADA